MNILSDYKQKKMPMRRKLFWYMLTLAIIVFTLLAFGLFLLGNFSSTKKTTAKDLSFQLSSYERQVNKYYDNLEMMGLSLSDNIGKITDNFLTQNNIDLSDVNDNRSYVLELQHAVFDKLREELVKTDCSGAFVIFNATVNTSAENANFSKTGLYFQRSTLDATDESILLYRGIAALGREHNIMPHRKWRLEFRTDLIPEWDNLPQLLSVPVQKSTYLLNTLTLPGTSERAMHFIVPITAKKTGVHYGFCGFEISESYFKKNFAQATQIPHLTCLLTKAQEKIIDPSSGFSAGVYNGYYLAPKDELTLSDFGNDLVTLSGNTSYIGKIQNTVICNGNYLLTVMIPQSEYNQAAVKKIIKTSCFTVLLLGVIVCVCIMFSRKFLAPLLKGLEQIRKQEHKSHSSTFAEIDDLFVFLAEQDRINDEEKETLKREIDRNVIALENQKSETQRLAYSRKNEVDPDDYEVFKNGINSLTKTEKIVFDLYLSGKTAKEILEILSIQESTLKYHNHNILGKLNVSSRKEMLRFATILNNETTGDDSKKEN